MKTPEVIKAESLWASAQAGARLVISPKYSEYLEGVPESVTNIEGWLCCNGAKIFVADSFSHKMLPRGGNFKVSFESFPATDVPSIYKLLTYVKNRDIAEKLGVRTNKNFFNLREGDLLFIPTLQLDGTFRWTLVRHAV